MATLSSDEQYEIVLTDTIYGYSGLPSDNTYSGQLDSLKKYEFPANAVVTIVEVDNDRPMWCKLSDGTWINTSINTQINGNEASDNYIKYTAAMNKAQYYHDLKIKNQANDGSGSTVSDTSPTTVIAGKVIRAGNPNGNYSESVVMYSGTTRDFSSVAQTYTNRTFNRIISAIKAYGAPPQWTEYVDPRILKINYDNNAILELGRRFAETVVSSATILSLAPGIIEYNATLTGDDSTFVDAVTNAVDAVDAAIPDIRNSVEDASGSFISFTPAWNKQVVRKNKSSAIENEAGYVAYLNALSKLFVIYASRTQNYENNTDESSEGTPLSARTVPGLGCTYKDIDWEKIDGIDNVPFSANSTRSEKFMYVNFFASGQNQISEEFETSVRSTTIEDQINGTVSGALKDVAFLTGGVIGQGLVEEDVKQLVSNTGNSIGGMLGNILAGGTEMLKGGKIIFPQIIDDCTFGKSTSFTTKFISVSGDIESIMWNAIFGYLHFLPFVIPRQIESAVDMYSYPFLCRAFSKGIYNCPVGVLKNFRIQRAGQDDTLWSCEALPREIEVQFDITPLYSKISMSHFEGLRASAYAIKNSGLQEYVATLTGVDLRLGEVDLKLATLASLAKGWLMDIPERVALWAYSVSGGSDIVRWGKDVLSGLDALSGDSNF